MPHGMTVALRWDVVRVNVEAGPVRTAVHLPGIVGAIALKASVAARADRDRDFVDLHRLLTIADRQGVTAAQLADPLNGRAVPEGDRIPGNLRVVSRRRDIGGLSREETADLRSLAAYFAVG